MCFVGLCVLVSFGEHDFKKQRGISVFGEYIKKKCITFLYSDHVIMQHCSSSKTSVHHSCNSQPLAPLVGNQEYVPFLLFGYATQAYQNKSLWRVARVIIMCP